MEAGSEARITMTLAGDTVLYRWHGADGDEVTWHGDPLPEKVLADLHLLVVGMSAYNKGESVQTTYRRQEVGPGPTGAGWAENAKDETTLSLDEARVRPCVTLPEEAPLQPIRAKDGTIRPGDYDWKLDVRPYAVPVCGLELRPEGAGERICMKEPPTTKAAHREDEHRRATLLIYSAEQGRRGYGTKRVNLHAGRG